VARLRLDNIDWRLGEITPCPARTCGRHGRRRSSLFEAGYGWRYSLWVTNRPAATRGRLGQCAYLDAARRVHARAEDVIILPVRTPAWATSRPDYRVNQAWLAASMIAAILLA
jgi:hypothetical protein